MIAVKGRYNGSSVVLDRTPEIRECEVIVTFLEPAVPEKHDDGSLGFLFAGYADDGVREPPVDFGGAVGNELW